MGARCIAIFAGLSLLLICSCEKHRVGEMPEAQREHVELGKKGKEGATSEELKIKSSNGASPTPAEFFPEKKNP
jgi:hypothetical protein